MSLNIKQINKYITYILLFYYQFCNYTGSGVGIWSPSVFVHSVFLGVLILHSIATVFICDKNTLSIKYLVLFLLPYAVLLGMLNGAVRSNTMFGLTIGCLLLLGTCLTAYDDNEILKFIMFLAIPSCLLSLFELSRFDASDVARLVVVRGELWLHPIFYCASFFWLVNVLVISSFVNKNKYWLAALCFIISFILNLIATKRLFIVETAWIVIILLYYLPRIRGRAKNVVPFIIFIVIITGALYYYSGTSSINMSELAESQTSRFEEEDIEATGFVRFRESGHAFAISSPFSIIMGHGFGVPHHGLSTTSDNHSLHIGITNLIYQFGLFLVIPYLILLFRSLRGLRNIKSLYGNDRWRLISILVVLSQIPSFLFVASFWTPTPTTTFFWYFLCRSVMTKKSNILENEKIIPSTH